MSFGKPFSYPSHIIPPPQYVFEYETTSISHKIKITGTLEACMELFKHFVDVKSYLVGHGCFKVTSFRPQLGDKGSLLEYKFSE